MPAPASSITLTTGRVAEKPMPMAGWAVVGSYAAGVYGMVRGLSARFEGCAGECGQSRRGGDGVVGGDAEGGVCGV